jgi:PBSX family phage terminase large subunit
MSLSNNITFERSAFLDCYYPLIDNKDRIIFLWGGRDSGKSHFAAQKLVIDCLRLPYFRCIMVKKTFESIKDSQWQTLKDIIHDWGLQDLFTFTVAPLSITCVNGNKFIARGCDKAEKIKSIKDPSHVWYEEGNQLSEQDHITIQTSIRSEKAEYLQEIFCFNPEAENGEPDEFWLFKKYFAGRSEMTFRGEIKTDVDSVQVLTPITSVHTTYKDNKYCTPQRAATLEQLRITDPYYYEVYTLGLWGTKENKNPFITTFDETKHISDLAVLQPHKQVLMSIDFNLNPFCAIFAHYWRDSQGYHLHIFDEISIEHGNIPKMIEEIKVRFPMQLRTIQITGDFQGKRRDISQQDTAHYYEQIRRGLNVSISQLKLVPNPSHDKSRQDTNLVIHNIDFKVNPKCKGVIYDLKHTKCDKHGGLIKANRKDLSQRADFIDTVRYVVNTFCQDVVKSIQKMSNFTKK